MGIRYLSAAAQAKLTLASAGTHAWPYAGISGLATTADSADTAGNNPATAREHG